MLPGSRPGAGYRSARSARTGSAGTARDGTVRDGEQQPVPCGHDRALADAEGELAVVHQPEHQVVPLVPDRAQQLAGQGARVDLGQLVPGRLDQLHHHVGRVRRLQALGQRARDQLVGRHRLLDAQVAQRGPDPGRADQGRDRQVRGQLAQQDRADQHVPVGGAGHQGLLGVLRPGLADRGLLGRVTPDHVDLALD